MHWGARWDSFALNGRHELGSSTCPVSGTAKRYPQEPQNLSVFWRVYLEIFVVRAD